MRKLLIVSSLALAALALPASSIGGGWATVGLSPPPDDMGPGQTWNAEMRILQHGVRPLEGVEPIVMISKSGSSDQSFSAEPTGEPGVYVAKVVFPQAGEWSYRVDDGFSRTHTFSPVSIGGAAAGDGGFPVTTVTAVIAVVLALAAVLFLLARRLRVRAPAPTH
jgi:hypothetical protein